MIDKLSKLSGVPTLLPHVCTAAQAAAEGTLPLLAAACLPTCWPPAFCKAASSSSSKAAGHLAAAPAPPCCAQASSTLRSTPLECTLGKFPWLVSTPLLDAVNRAQPVPLRPVAAQLEGALGVARVGAQQSPPGSPPVLAAAKAVAAAKAPLARVWNAASPCHPSLLQRASTRGCPPGCTSCPTPRHVFLLVHAPAKRPQPSRVHAARLLPPLHAHSPGRRSMLPLPLQCRPSFSTRA